MKSNEQLLSQVESYISQIALPEEPKRLYEPITYTLTGGGKRLRPMLTMLACGIFCDDTQHALPAAAAIEIFHNFTLLHDDIMDNAPIRRSKPTVHAAWGQNVAILSGDVMMILAYSYLNSLPAKYLPDVLARFNRFAIDVCEGQQYDMDFEGEEVVSIEEYMRMIELKTSVLLGGATVVGAILGDATAEQRAKLDKFATELGLAFQLQDDLLDSYGDEALGKSIGGDILEGKKTFLMITALNRANDEERQKLKTIYKDSTKSDAEKIAEVKAIYDALDVPRLTEELISAKFNDALAILDSLDVEPQRIVAMRQYAEGLVDRKS
ncbi:MAG: polyprenyl synthetase family protein [Rikenellaceae bacterium]